jgi:hypothetical protein
MMADIFISYANEDRERAAQVAALLESAGWSVWWDRRIPAGRTWRTVLEEALGGSRCMMVLWSNHSVTSPWVAEEAEEARRLNKTLVPVLINAVEPPIGFRAIQAADLIRWDGSADDAAARMLVADLKSLVNPQEREKNRPVESITAHDVGSGEKLRRWLALHWSKVALGALAVAAGFFILQQDWSGSEPTPPSELTTHEPVPGPRLTRLAVSGKRNRIKPSETVKLTLKGQYSDGSQSDLSVGVEWLSSDTAVAVVDEQGEVTGLKAGRTNIIAKIAGVESSEWTLGVEAPEPPKPAPPPRLVGLEVSSTKQELVANEKIGLRAKATYSDRSEKYLASGIEWRVSDRTVAALNDRGELIARRPGKVEVVARADNVSSPGLTVVVKESLKPPESKPLPVKPVESPPAKAAVLSEQKKSRVAAYVSRAQTYREQGNYGAALAELERARSLDAASEEVRREIDQTKRACNAEKVLGNPVQC